MLRLIIRACTTTLLTLGLLSSLVGPAAAQTPTPIGGSVRFVAAPGTTFDVPGLGRFSDTLELLPGPDGRLVVVNDLAMDTYVEGLAEVPASWPMESLKAQAVAARTYAWYSIGLGTFRERGYPFDICATVACQVFHGREIAESENGHRWVEAVRSTSNEVLTYGNAPILARFFSSSGGHTRDNEDVFGFGRTEGPRPYLKGVEDPDEAISPHHRWGFRLTRVELDQLFAHGSTLGAAVPVANLEWLPGDGDPNGRRTDVIRATRTDGHQVELSASKFRAWVSEIGPQLFPHRFPIRNAEGKALPDGLPSSRFEFEVTPLEVVVTGKGWGHGVGMSQWGARGKAERGVGYADILHSYYTDVQLGQADDMPERVRVGMTWEATDVAIRADGPFTVLASGLGGADVGAGAWRVTQGNAASVILTGPPGVNWDPAMQPPPPPPPPPAPAPPVDDLPAAAAVPDGDDDVTEVTPPAEPQAPAEAAPVASGTSFMSRVGRAVTSFAPPITGGVLEIFRR